MASPFKSWYVVTEGKEPLLIETSYENAAWIVANRAQHIVGRSHIVEYDGGILSCKWPVNDDAIHAVERVREHIDNLEREKRREPERGMGMER